MKNQTMTDVAYNITSSIEPEAMPACPICGDPICDDRNVVLVRGYDMLGLAHVECASRNAD